MILQLSPPLNLETPKGPGLAWLVIDYGIEHNIMWVVAINDTGEIWTFPNPQVRAEKNITMGRIIDDNNLSLSDNQKGLLKTLVRIEKLEDGQKEIAKMLADYFDDCDKDREDEMNEDNLIKTYFKGMEDLCKRIEYLEKEIKILKSKLDANIYT